jgi:prephenate dehydrogenase
MKKIFFNKITILGVGLIGASFALALRERGLCRHITGYGRSEKNIKRAKGMKIIDSYELDASRACMDSDLILFSMPVGSFTGIARKIKGVLKKGVIVTDVGSIKGKLVREMEKLMPEGVAFVGGHPIAGSDRSGIDAASPDLFKGARCILTPTKKTDKKSLNTIRRLWKELGARVTILDPEEHDRMYAAVSHFPHVVAYEVVNTVAHAGNCDLGFAGQGFKDTTRIAASSPELWSDIFFMNRKNILRLIERFKINLDKFSDRLKNNNKNALMRELKKAKALRENVR